MQTISTQRRKIQRNHTGCRPCRRRGKRCDETKPCCRACVRLSLECSYGANFTFQNVSGALFQQQDSAKTTRHRSTPSESHIPNNAYISHLLEQLCNPKVPATLDSGINLDGTYFDHFQRHVRHLHPISCLRLTEESLRSPCLYFSALCISASNLSMLNAQVQSRMVVNDTRKSVFSPLVNNLHHSQALKYHDQAFWHCRVAKADEVQRQAPIFLAAHILLAYYHHASTNHQSFRSAVCDTVRFVMLNRASILELPGGTDALQMWYRLCTSHRPAKPPALLLEGEGISSFGPNIFPDATDQLYLNCILGMSVDDLIYDILIKTMEIRTKLVLFRCVAGSCNVSELSSQIGSLSHEVWNKMLGRHSVSDEYAEAREGFVRGSHLLGLLDVQNERLKVWKSRLTADQLPANFLSNLYMHGKTGQHASSPPMGKTFPTHRNAMNVLYCMLCEITFQEAHGAVMSDHDLPSHDDSATTVATLAHSICQIAGTLDFTTSNTSDVYTFSLAETLLQLVFLWRSDAIFDYILDVLWPQLETKGRGYEHSHYPTHLAKRIITQVAAYWAQGRVVDFSTPAVTENISKLQLLDIDHPVDMVICGQNKDGTYFVERIPLP